MRLSLSLDGFVTSSFPCGSDSLAYDCGVERAPDDAGRRNSGRRGSPGRSLLRRVALFVRCGAPRQDEDEQVSHGSAYTPCGS